MKRKLSILALLLLGTEIHANEFSVFSRATAFAYAENNAIYHIFKGGKQEFENANWAFTYNQVSTGLNYGNSTIEVLYRYDWWLTFSEDTLNLFSEASNKDNIPVGKLYDLALKTSHFSGAGVRFSHKFGFDSFDLKPSLSLLNGNTFIEGAGSGTAALKGQCASDPTCYVGEVHLEQHYTRDYLLKRAIVEPYSKYGYSLDMELSWFYNDHIEIAWEARDLYSQILWKNAPYTEITVSEPDFSAGKAIMSGFEGYRDFVQKLPSKNTLGLHWHIDSTHQTKVKAFRILERTLWSAEYEYLSDLGKLTISGYPSQKAIGLEFQSKWVELGVKSDSFDYKKANFLKLILGVKIPF